MRTNTSVSLGSYFDRFVESKISEGRYKNASEVIRAGLRLLEEDENKLQALKAAIKEGDESGIAEEVDFDELLVKFKADRDAGLQCDGKA
jgi:antitoxin ParD1/3/4